MSGDPSGLVMVERATIENVDFRRASFDKFASSGCIFVNCDFRGLAFEHRLATLFASRIQSVFRECKFDEADLRRTGPGQSRFERCSFDGARLDGWTSLCGEFIECTFAGPIRKAKFHGRPYGAQASALMPARSANEFRRNDLTKTVLIDTVFVHGIPMGQQKWPTKGHVRLDKIQQRFERGRLEVMKWKDAPARTEAIEMIMRLSTVHGEQLELVRVEHDPTLQASPELQDRVWEVLGRPLDT